MAVDRPGASGDGWDAKTLALAWGAVLAGPAAWTFNQGVGYVLVKPICASAGNYVLWSIAAAAFLLVAAGSWIGWQSLAVLRGPSDHAGSQPRDQRYFLAVLALSFNGIIAVLLAAALIPQLLLSACE